MTTIRPQIVKKSFSQCGEDLIVQFIFQALGVRTPVYMDVGAFHPFYLSNTALFYETGSRGLNVEPDPIMFQEFVRYRAEDVNLNIGVAEKEGEMDFYLMSAATLNTFSKTEAEKFKAENGYQIRDICRIPVETIPRLIDTHFNGRCPDFLSIDVEGLDETILHTLDYQKYAPTVICVETISFSETRKGVKDEALISFLEKQGYLKYADTYINSIFVRKQSWSGGT